MPVLSAPASPTHELPHARFTSLATPSRGTSETSVWRVEIAPGEQGCSPAGEDVEVLELVARVEFRDENRFAARDPHAPELLDA